VRDVPYPKRNVHRGSRLSGIARSRSEFPLPTSAAFPSFPAPLQAALFTNEDPEGFHAANLQNRPS
jgi:hypothetical protein